jgi:short-subunit dehydrogenase involved in D-alanine esterification of teichoic acids
MGSTVVICWRTEEHLCASRTKHPQLRTSVYDIAKDEDRRAVLAWGSLKFPVMAQTAHNFPLNVLRTNSLAHYAHRLGYAQRVAFQP